MAAPKLIHKPFSFIVDTPNTSYSPKFTLDKNVVLVRGLLMSSNDPKSLFFRGSQRIEINGDELYPEDYESKLLMSGLSVSPDDKYVTLGDGAIAGNGEIKVLYKDTDNLIIPFTAYKVTIVLKCELK